MLTAKVEPEQTGDGVDKGMERYNPILEALACGPDQEEATKVGDGTTYYNAEATIATSGMNTDAVTFEPELHDDEVWHIGDIDDHRSRGDSPTRTTSSSNDNERKDAIALVAHE